MKPTTAPSTVQAATPVVHSLHLVLADSYALMAITHDAHWNVQGGDFFALHSAFQSHYENLFEAIDELAERIRALDAHVPGGLATFARAAGIEEFNGPRSAKDYVAGLVTAHEKTLADLLALRDASGAANDAETQDIAIGRIQWHQKTLWMLKSYLK
jgi:starvation-inducible DNA-binding protein